MISTHAYVEMMKGSATNLAPWLITVAASSIDKEFTSKLVMGNGVHLKVPDDHYISNPHHL